MPNFGMMTSQHVVYIPLVLTVGVLIGYQLGARAVKKQLDEKRRRMKE